MKPIKSIIIEGVDRLGKDSLIDGIMNHLGFYQVVHFQKPSLLKYYTQVTSQVGSTESINNSALQLYQRDSFINMFHMLSSRARYIFNRSHLGEVVYSHYRKYDGSYVFDLEQSFIDQGSDFNETTLLILLHTSDFSFIKDDGLSFDFSKKESEQDKFVWALERSKIEYKMMIDVCDGNGAFVPKETILSTVVQCIKDFPSFPRHFANVSWRHSEDDLIRNFDLQIDPQKVF